MKILRILFKNLNSLKGQHTIDLEQEPLASSGIFAITGMTGSGKSTILDAITLALYGRAARYGNVPSPGDIMSRHTGECSAEVEFEVKKGRFRAVWQLRRAQNKPHGDFQQPKRYVYDSQGNALTQKIRDTDQLIEELTGLDADRFFRSVLLAQGDFAKFLKAKSDDRAGLLESLTGTTIYSELGCAAYRMASDKESELANQEKALNEIELLTEELRTGTQKEIEKLANEIKIREKEEERLTNLIKLGDQFLQFHEDLKQVQINRQTLDREVKAADPMIKRLISHSKAQVFLPDILEYDQTSGNVESAKEKTLSEETRLTAAKRTLRAGYNAATDLAVSLIGKGESDLEDLKTQRASKISDLSDLESWIKDHLHDLSLDRDLTSIISLLTSLSSERKQKREAAESQSEVLEKKETALKNLVPSEDELKNRLEALKQKEIHAGKAKQAVEDLLKGRTTAIIQDELNGKKLYLEILNKCDESSSDCIRIKRELGELSAQKEVALKKRNAMNDALNSQSDDIGVLESEIHRKHLIVNLEEHRSKLKTGETCPLCGAIEHPYVQSGMQFLSDTAEQEKNLENAKKALNEIRRKFDLASSECDKTEGLLEAKEKEESKAVQRLQSISWELEAFLSERKIIKKSGVLASEILLTKDAISQREKCLDDVREAERALHEAEKGVLKQQRLADESKNLLSEVQKAASDADDQIARSQEHILKLNEAISLVELQLSNLLHPYSVSLPPPDEEKKLQDSLVERKDLFRDKTESQKKTRSELDVLDGKIKNASSICKALREQSDNLKVTEDILNTPSDFVHEKAFKKQWLSLSDSREKLVQLQSAVTSAADSVSDARESQGKLEKKLAQVNENISKRLVDTEFKDIKELKAARLPDDEANRIEQMKKDQQADIDKLIGTETHILSQLKNLKDNQAPDKESLKELKGKKLSISKEILDDRSKVVLLKDKIDRDDQARKNYAAKQKDLLLSRDRLKIWSRLSHLIGSNDGKKFRIFAQGLSLDLLIRRANIHLGKLNGRYRLCRIDAELLGLEIQDLHQANSVRPTESLSGGESFLVSLALALGLSDLAGRKVRIDSLFIDEGFGSLDLETLDVAISALETLQRSNKTIGIISHIPLLQERIKTQIHVEKGLGGVSTLKFG